MRTVRGHNTAGLSDSHIRARKSEHHLIHPVEHNPLILALVNAFMMLPLRAQNAQARFLNIWTTTTAERRAILLKLLVPNLPDEVVAETVGVARTTLYNWPSYKRLKAILAAVPDILNGTLDGDGFVIDAWYADSP